MMLSRLRCPCATFTRKCRTLVGSIATGTSGIVDNNCGTDYGRNLVGSTTLLGAGSTPSAGQKFFINNRLQNNALNVAPATQCGANAPADDFPHAIVSSVSNYASSSGLNAAVCSLQDWSADGSGQVRLVATAAAGRPP